MADVETSDSPDLYAILLRSGFEGHDAHRLIDSLKDMAADNLIHQFGSKLDAQT